MPPDDEPPDSPQPDYAWLAARRKSWARLIRRVYEVDPLLCPCGQKMRVVGFLAQAAVVRKILTQIGRHSGLAFEPRVGSKRKDWRALPDNAGHDGEETLSSP